jgi:hypothetical protein
MAKRAPIDTTRLNREKWRRWVQSTDDRPLVGKALAENAATGDERTRLMHAIQSLAVEVVVPSLDGNGPDLVIVSVTKADVRGEVLTATARPKGERWDDRLFPGDPKVGHLIRGGAVGPFWFTHIVPIGTCRSRLWGSLMAQAHLKRHPRYADLDTR